jgi:hypothetical protein
MSNVTTVRPVLPEDRYCPNSAIAESRLAELQKEMPPGHLLYEKSVEVFACSDRNDDVLFRHLKVPERLTVVHLTWIRKREINAQHPRVVFGGTRDEFIAGEKRISDSLTER